MVLEEEDFMEAIKSPDRRVQLEALRDKVANELSVNKCAKCSAIALRASDTAALVLRLQKILEELASLPVVGEEKNELEKLQERTAVGGTSNVISLGTKHAPRQQGGRRRERM